MSLTTPDKIRTLQRKLIRPGRFRLERELPGGTCTHDIDAPWQGTQWNKIEHRLFCHITQTWRGRPLIGREAVVEPIASTTTKAGLTVRCELDTPDYPKGYQGERRGDENPQYRGRRIPSRMELYDLAERTDLKR
jgi:hypothetical protein